MGGSDAQAKIDSPLLPGEKPTLKTIARISGLAVPTVSRALNDAPDIKAKTKELVRGIANDLGYVPNRAGLRLRTGRTNVISLILSAESEVLNHNAKLISAVAQELRGTPFHLNVSPFFGGEDVMARVRYVVETGSADAVIFNQTTPDDPRIAYLLEKRFPFVTHGRSSFDGQTAWADYDNDAFAYIAASRLAAKGRRNILMLAPPMTQSYSQHMVSGAQRAAQEAGLKLRFSGEITSDSANAEITASVKRTLAADPGIDGVICGSMMSAIATVAAIEERGHKIGEDFDLAAKEALPFLQLFRPAIMAVSEDVGQAGAFLAKAAMRRISHPDEAPMQHLEVPRDD